MPQEQTSDMTEVTVAVVEAAAGTEHTPVELTYLDRFHAGAEPGYNYRLMSLIRSRHPLLFVSTPEEDRFLDHLKHLVMASDYLAYRWDCVHGLQCLNPNMSHAISEEKQAIDPVGILRHIIEKVKKVRNSQYRNARGVVFVLCDFYKYLSPKYDPKVERLLRELAHESRGGTVIVTGPKYLNSDGLGHVFENLLFPRPNREEISFELDAIIGTKGVQGLYPGITEYVNENRDALVDAVLGLTMAEIKAAYMQTIASAKELDHHPLELGKLIEAKRSAISKNDALTYVDSQVELDHIGGLDPMLDWVRDRKLAFSPEAREFGIVDPRGVLLCGVPGMGKSLSAKGIARFFGRPLLRLDLGAVMDSLVGESEANIREAIALAETLAPCVTGEAKVYDSNGVVYTIDDLMSDKSLFKSKPFFTYSFNEDSLQIERTRVEAVVKKPRKRDIVEIVTANAQLRVTADHKMMIIRDGQLEWIEAVRIKADDFVVSPKKLMRDPIPFDLRDALDESFDIDEKGVRGPNCEDILFAEDGFTAECALYIAGMLDGSGFLEGEDLVVFDGDFSSKAHLFSSRAYAYTVAMQACFGIEPELQDQEDGTTQCYVHNKAIYQIIEYIRKNLISFNDELVSAYLSGFVESSSNIQLGRNAKISFIVEDSEERDRLCRALHCIGIVAPRRTYRTVFIASQHEIDTLARAVVERVSSDHLSKLITHAVGDCSRRSKHIGYHLGGMISAEDSRNESEVATLVTSDVVGIRVMSVDPVGKDTVYDLSCEGNHNFFANNLLCHNCVLWVDEVEKALSAAVGKGSGDSGTTKRVISTFLTWMQEKTKSVFVVCTANNMEDIPPEFMRAGRLDEVFFIDLPDAAEREVILRIMLTLKGIDPNKMPKERGFSLKRISEHKNLEGFSGAEIEKAVNEALFYAFKEKRDLKMSDIVRAAGQFKPLSKMRAEEIEAMREWAEENARFANTHKVKS